MQRSRNYDLNNEHQMREKENVFSETKKKEID